MFHVKHSAGDATQPAVWPAPFPDSLAEAGVGRG
jgi:hypothetical protein